MIPKLKKENLLGRSGSDFPVYLKWKKIKSSKEKTKYIICNASEGDPQTKKDYYLLKKYLKDIINGIEIAIKELEVKTAYIYINKKYYDEFKEDLIKLTINLPIELVRKPEGYLKGEETVIINIIEEKPAVPKIKPPYPTEQGLFEKPTLIHNVETFYCISKIYKNEYKKERFYYVNNKTFKLKDNSTVKEILTNTKNFPKFDFSSRLAVFQVKYS